MKKEREVSREKRPLGGQLPEQSALRDLVKIRK